VDILGKKSKNQGKAARKKQLPTALAGQLIFFVWVLFFCMGVLCSGMPESFFGPESKLELGFPPPLKKKQENKKNHPWWI